LKWYSAYSFFVGLLYVIYGALEVINGAVAWWTPLELNLQLGLPFYGEFLPKAVSDPFFGFVMLVLGSIFILGGKRSLEGLEEGWGPITVALLLSGALAVLSLLVIGADWLDSTYPVLFGEEAGEWSILAEDWALNPGLILFPLALPLIKVYRAGRMRMVNPSK